ncbi:hypothetical protein [Paenibacillus sp. WLX2291]|uniref:hypothetical protein n=1 Tax=Paenibacillus sp. WLX2291 TaxID=3296934 RepID=UPI003983EE16
MSKIIHATSDLDLEFNTEKKNQSETYANKEENELNKLSTEVYILLQEILLSAQEMQSISCIKKVSKIEKRFWIYKLRAKKDIKKILNIKENCCCSNQIFKNENVSVRLLCILCLLI